MKLVKLEQAQKLKNSDICTPAWYREQCKLIEELEEK